MADATARTRLLSKVDALLERGLRFHREGRVEDAVVVWQHVLEIEPNDPRARDLLVSVGPRRRSGMHRVVRLPAEAEGGAVDRAALGAALKDRRYEDALAVLASAHEQAPEDAAIVRGIIAIREHMEVRLARRVGGLAAILEPIPGSVDPGPGARQILGVLGAGATLEEILARSPLARHETCAVLYRLLDARALLVATDFEVLFARAAEAYLDGDVPAAHHLYRACLEARPDHRVAAHNLAVLEARLARRR